jgi:hypothetical protein
MEIFLYVGIQLPSINCATLQNLQVDESRIENQRSGQKPVPRTYYPARESGNVAFLIISCSRNYL